MKQLFAMALLTLLAISFGPVASAHVSSNGFLVVQVNGQELHGSMELAVRDVELALGADANQDGRITWGELRAAQPRLQQYLATHLQLGAPKSDCALNFQPLQVNERVDGNYAWVPFSAHCPAALRQLCRTWILRIADCLH
jgi:hypothetical protein